jgi:HSP20 family protein
MEMAMAETAVNVTKTPALTPARRAGASDIWSSFRNEMDRLFDRFDGGLRGFLDMPAPSGMQTFEFGAPAVDLEEDDKAYRITAELPGLDEKQIEVSVSEDTLTLKGEKRQERQEKEKNHYLSERSYGAFQRTFRLPVGVDREKIAATMSKGVLTLVLPKTAEAQQQTRKIEVKAS